MNIRLTIDGGISSILPNIDLSTIDKYKLKELIGTASSFWMARDFVEKGKSIVWYKCPFISSTAIGEYVIKNAENSVKHRHLEVHYGEVDGGKFVLINSHGKCDLYFDDEATRESIFMILDSEVASLLKKAPLDFIDIVELSSADKALDQLVNKGENTNVNNK